MTSTLDFLKRLNRIWPYFRAGKPVMFLCLVATLTSSLTEPMVPALLKPLLDQGFQQGTFSVWIVPASLLLLFGIRGLAGFLAQYGLTKFTNTGLFNLRESMFQKVMTARLNLFSDQSSSALTNTLVYEVYNGSTLLAQALISLIRDTFSLIALVGYLCYLNWKLTLIVGFLFPTVAYVMRVLSKRLYRLAKTSQNETDKLAYVVEENVLAHRDVRLHIAQSEQRERFKALSDSLRRLSIKSSIAASAMTPLTQMLAAVALSAVISIALIQNGHDGEHSVGSFVAFVTAMLMLIAPIKHLSEVANPITRGLVAIERGIDLIETTQSETQGSFSKKRALGRIQFENVSVSYGTDSSPAVCQINLDVSPGEIVALVGASGAGKSTLVNLLPRFIEPNSGSVLLDGENIVDWQLESLRSQFAFVSQHVVMLSGTIASNVAIGQEIDRARVVDCLNSANLSRFISELQKGIDTEVGHNAMQLSGGQRQRLAIARALYKNAPILILDEATSALDGESERAVQEALERLMKNRTTLVIAHRLSTVHHANRIVVMDAGKIIEMGDHAELLKLSGQYANLYALGLHEPK